MTVIQRHKETVVTHWGIGSSNDSNITLNKDGSLSLNFAASKGITNGAGASWGPTSTGSFLVSPTGLSTSQLSFNGHPVSAGMYVSGVSAGTAAQTRQVGLLVDFASNVNATDAFVELVVEPTLTAGSYTVTDFGGLRVNGSSVGAGVTVTSYSMLQLQPQSGQTGVVNPVTNFFGMDIAGITSTATNNIAIRVAGPTGPGAVTLQLNGSANGGGSTLVQLTPGLDTAVIAEKPDIIVFASTSGITAPYAVQRSLQYQQQTIASLSANLIGVAAAVSIESAFNWSGSAQVTTNVGLLVGNTNVSVGNVAGTSHTEIAIPAHTVTMLNGTHVTSANGVSGILIGQTTIAGNTTTVDNAQSLLIVGPPIQGAGATVTNIWSERIISGNVSWGGHLGVYNAVATAGWGVPALYSVVRPAQQTNTTVALATYTVGAADGSFEISANVNVTTSTTVTMTVTCSYHDEANTARVLTIPFFILAGTLVQSITTAQGNIAYSSLPITIRAKAGTTITLATAGTVTAVVYTAEGIIKQIA